MTVLGNITTLIALVAGTFPLIERRLRRWLEQLLFRDVYDYRQAVQQIGGEIASLAGVDAVAEHSLARLGQTLDLSWATIELYVETDSPTVYRWGNCPADLDQTALVPMPTEPWTAAAVSATAPIAVTLVAEGVSIGRLAVGPKQRDLELSADDKALVSSLAPLVATALQNGLLLKRLKDKVVSLGERERDLAALSLQLMTVQEEERRRLALDLHDDPLQRAIFLARDLQRADNAIAKQSFKAVEDIILSLRAICTDLRPPVLDDLGLVAGLENLLNEVRVRSDVDASLVVNTLDGQPFGRLRPEVEVALYRVAQEALNNCVKHAEASHVSVRLARDQQWIHLEVADDGRGYTVTASSDRGRAVHLGLVGMRERLRPCNGTLTMTTGGEGGTVVSAKVPLGGDNGIAH